MFTLTVFEIWLFECKWQLWPTQQCTRRERVKVWVKNQKKYWELLGKGWNDKIRRFWMVFRFLWFSLTLSVPEKLKKSIFEIPICTQILNINNLRATSGNSINLHTIIKFVEYSLKFSQSKSNVSSYRFWDITVRG